MIWRENISIEGFVFDDQANFGEQPDQKIPQGSEFSLSYDVAGSANVYQWYRNDEIVINAETSIYSIDSITFEQMGEYRLEVRNSIINAINPDFSLNSNSVDIVATSTISGKVQVQMNFLLKVVGFYLFEISSNGSYDSVRLEKWKFLSKHPK